MCNYCHQLQKCEVVALQFFCLCTVLFVLLCRLVEFDRDLQLQVLNQCMSERDKSIISITELRQISFHLTVFTHYTECKIYVQFVARIMLSSSFKLATKICGLLLIEVSVKNCQLSSMK